MYTNKRKKLRRLWRSFVGVHFQTDLAIPVFLVGFVGGCIGAAYLTVLHISTHWLGPDTNTLYVHALLLVLAGCGISILDRILGSSGSVELLVDNIHVLGGAEDLRQVGPLIPTSLLSIAAGGAMGPEAPLVQTTGSFGTYLAHRFSFTTYEVRILTITGMAAGFSVLFGAPVGAALFALEILHRRGLQYYEALVPALVGSLIGYSMNFMLTGVGLTPVWVLPEPNPLRGEDLLWGIFCGLLGAIGTWVFTSGITTMRRLLGKIPDVYLPIFGGVFLALLSLWSPYVLTNGEDQVNFVTAAHLSIGALIVAIAAKFIGVITTISCRWRGGFIIPLFFIGITCGQLFHELIPSTQVTILMVGIAVGLCVGVTKTPLGSTLVVTQMAGLTVLPMALIAAMTALLLTGGASMIDSQRSRVHTDNVYI